MANFWPLTSRGEVILSVVCYSFCSGSLVLINKLILHQLPYPSLVITVQLWAAIFFIYSLHFLGWIDIDPIKWKFVLPYLAYTVAFSVGVFCNMKSLSLSNVETVIVFRALAPIIVSVLDVAFLGREWPSARSWGALFIIALGAYGYASTDEKFKAQGMSAYFWPTLYLFVISFEMAYGKNIIRSVDLKTRSGPVQYTNILGWPPMLMFAGMAGEYKRFHSVWIDDGPTMFHASGLALLLVGCIVGTGIGYSSWWCRGQVSATSFTLIGVMNKCLTVIANCLIWDKHAVPAGIASLFLCLVGGSLYQQAPLRSGESKGTDTQKDTPQKQDEENAKVHEMGEAEIEAEQRIPLVQRKHDH